MKKTLFAVVIMAAFASPAFAISAVVSGDGGKGGSVSGGGGGVAGSGNSTNVNTLGQLQGQGQAAFGGAGGTASSGSSSSSGATSSSGGNTLTGGANSNTTTATQANEIVVNGDTVTYQAQERDPVATAYASPLTASNGTCMGSSSAGAQGASFGLSFGSTWSDSSCDLRYDAEALRAAGLPKAAAARLCQKAEIAQAMMDAGTPCPQAKQNVVVQTVVTAPKSTASGKTVQTYSVQPQYTDPIIRARLGLPAL